MEFSVLGAVSVRADGRELAIGGAKRRALLALLLVRANEVVAADRLIEDLWEGDPPASAAGTLQSHISALRRVLGAGRLHTRGGGYLLEVAQGDMDAAVFAAEVGEGVQALSAGDPATALQALGRALARWRGPALGALAGASWAVAEAARLEEQRLAAIEAQLEAWLALGQTSQVVSEAEKTVAEHPLRERLWALLMTALYRQGRQAEALRAYQRLRTHLAEELGIEPSVDLRTLEQQILAQDAALGSPPVAGPPAGTLPSGVVTFLLSDVVGSTRLWQTSARLMPDALAQHDGIVRQAVLAHGGVLLKARGEGDSTFSVFRRATDAAVAAAEAQVALQAATWPEGCAISVRMAVHTGESLERDGDYYGPTVNRAARLRAVADGGQILVSHAAAELVIDHLPGELRLVGLGPQELRDLDRPETVYLLASAAATPGGQLSGSEDAAVALLPARLAAVPAIGFVGRVGELDLLADCFKDAVQGHRQLVFIAGEPGIGKSALAASAARSAHVDGGLVLHGRCDEGLGVPYQPFVESLSHLVRHARRAFRDVLGDRRASELARLVPAVAERHPDLAPPPSADPETERWVFMNAVVAALSAASASAPVVLVLDDLQWADRGTLLLLRHLAATEEALRLLVIATYRDSELSAADALVDTLAALRREPGVERIALTGLGDVDLVALLEVAAGHQMDEPGVALAHALRRETDGNPFFIGEIVRHLSETGAVFPQDGRWVARDDLAGMGLPDSVREVVGRRVAHLGDAAQRVLSTAAVVGSDFELDVVAAALDLPEDDVLVALEQAEQAALVTSTGPGRFSFSHNLVVQTLHQDLTPTRRARAHRRVAEAIEGLGRSELRVAELARHWAAAAVPAEADRAVEYGRRAGNQALRSLSPHEAARWYRQALDLLAEQTSPDESRRCELLVRLGRAMRQAGDAAFRETLLEAGRLAQQLGDTEQLVRAALANSQGIGAFVAVDEDRISVLDAALAAIGTTDSAARARLLATLAAQTIITSDLGRRQALSDEALAIARRLGDQLTLLQVLNLRYNTIWVPMTLNERLANTAEAVALADELGDPVARFWAASWRHVALLEIADIDGAGRALDVMTAVATEVGQPLLVCIETQFRCGRAIAAGRLDEAERLDHERRALGMAINLDELRGGVMYSFAIRERQGRAAEMITEIEEAIAIRVNGEAFGYRPALAYCYCAAGESGRARALLDAALEQPGRLLTEGVVHMGAPALWAEICVSVGDDAQAATLFDLLLPFHDRTAGAASDDRSVAHTLAILAVKLGRNDAEGYFAEADSVNERLQSDFHRARSRVEWGRLLLSRRGTGDVERGVKLLQQALATARDHGYVVIEKAASSLLASGDAQPGP